MGAVGRPWDAPDVRARDDAGPGMASTVPGRIALGSGPMAGRLAAYRACHPPRKRSAAAMRAKVSPAPTV